MQKQGYRQSTIQSSVQALKGIARRANLLDPESAKAYLGLAKLSENRKGKLAEDLARFYRYMRVRFEKPRYRRVDTIPFVPMETEVDQLIAGVGKKTAAFLRLIKETGMRPGEAWNLKWTDVDWVNLSPRYLSATLTHELLHVFGFTDQELGPYVRLDWVIPLDWRARIQEAAKWFQMTPPQPEAWKRSTLAGLKHGPFRHQF
jgi:integrase